jgi:hypothetical protein
MANEDRTGSRQQTWGDADRAEREHDLTVRLLGLISGTGGLHGLMRSVTELLHERSGCEAFPHVSRQRKDEVMQTTSKNRCREGVSSSVDHFSKRVSAGTILLSVVAFLALGAPGCRMHPGSLATMVVGDALNDADVKDRRGLLMGKPEAAADTAFGSRLETLVDVDREGVSLVFYPVKNDLLKTSRYVVEVEGGVIVVLAKTKQNIDGIEDMIHNTSLEKKLIGKAPAECSQEGNLGVPLRTLRSRESQ